MQRIRQEKMNNLIQEYEILTINQLREFFPNVSLMTIHRDLDALADAKLIAKVRGGARTIRHGQDLTFEVRSRENLTGKAKVAERAARLLNGQSCVFLDSGTTSLALARLVQNSCAKIITTGPNIALSLAHTAAPDVAMCPGNLNKANLTVSGHSTLQFLDNINIDLAFIGVSGYGDIAGFTCGKEDEMMVKRHVISRARKTIILCDETKFNRLMPFTFARLEDVDVVVLDKEPPQDFITSAKDAGTLLIFEDEC